MTHSRHGGVGLRLMEGAKTLYEDLTEELCSAIRRIRADYLTDESKGLAEALKAHRKALQTLLEFELHFAKTAKDGETGHELDLDAARREVLGRLDRIAATRGDRTPD